ncbi:polysialoglycoprotein-like [Elysia marginata]|uniref:Polysialoglycoprotein-like n=1 Tax=Elysia marginata TaxID=1093978 RepID=A0AAV4JT23_9GAST|nr:polysialoglycoprotein-like [Elysia marginata]
MNRSEIPRMGCGFRPATWLRLAIILVMLSQCVHASHEKLVRVKTFLGPKVGSDGDPTPTVVLNSSQKLTFPPKKLEEFLQCICDKNNGLCEIDYFNYQAMSITPGKAQLSATDQRTVMYDCPEINKLSGTVLMSRTCTVNNKATKTIPKLKGKDADFKAVCDYRCIAIDFIGGAKFEHFGRGPYQGNLFCAERYDQAGTTEKQAGDIHSSTTEKATANIDSGTTEKTTGDIDSSTTEKTTGDIDSSTTEKRTADIDSGTTEKTKGNIDSGTTEKTTGDIKSDTTEKTTGDIDSDTTEKTTGDIDSYSTENTTGHIDSGTTEKTTGDIDSGTTERTTGDIDSSTSEKTAGSIDSSTTDKTKGDIDIGTTEKTTGNIDSGTTEKTTGDIKSGTTDKTKGNIDSGTTEETTADIDSSTTEKTTGDIDSATTVMTTSDIDRGNAEKTTGDIDSGTTEKTTGDIDSDTTENTASFDSGITEKKTDNVDSGTTENAKGDVDSGTNETTAGDEKAIGDIHRDSTKETTYSIDSGTTEKTQSGIDSGTTQNTRYDIDSGTTVEKLETINNTTGAIDVSTTGNTAGDSDVGTTEKTRVDNKGGGNKTVGDASFCGRPSCKQGGESNGPDKVLGNNDKEEGDSDAGDTDNNAHGKDDIVSDRRSTCECANSTSNGHSTVSSDIEGEMGGVNGRQNANNDDFDSDSDKDGDGDKDKVNHREKDKDNIHHSAKSCHYYSNDFILVIVGLSLSLLLNFVQCILWSSRLCNKSPNVQRSSSMSIIKEQPIFAFENATYIEDQTRVRNGSASSRQADRNLHNKSHSLNACDAADKNACYVPENVYEEPGDLLSPFYSYNERNVCRAAFSSDEDRRREPTHTTRKPSSRVCEEEEEEGAREIRQGISKYRTPANNINRDKGTNKVNRNNKERPNFQQNHQPQRTHLERDSNISTMQDKFPGYMNVPGMSNDVHQWSTRNSAEILADYYATPTSRDHRTRPTRKRRESRRHLLSFSSEGNDVPADYTPQLQHSLEMAEAGLDVYRVPRVQSSFSSSYSSSKAQTRGLRL